MRKHPHPIEFSILFKVLLQILPTPIFLRTRPIYFHLQINELFDAFGEPLKFTSFSLVSNKGQWISPQSKRFKLLVGNNVKKVLNCTDYVWFIFFN